MAWKNDEEEWRRIMALNVSPATDDVTEGSHEYGASYLPFPMVLIQTCTVVWIVLPGHGWHRTIWPSGHKTSAWP